MIPRAFLNSPKFSGLIYMDSASISALAALAGAAVGGLTSFATSWMIQQAQFKAQQHTRELSKRQELYKDFIEEASTLYGDSLTHGPSDLSQLVRLYAMISRMRILSVAATVENADKVALTIVNTYLAPNRTFPELRDMVNNGGIDLLREFSEAVREESQRLEYF